MTGYRENVRTDERMNKRTDGRTDIGQSIGPTSKVGGSNNITTDQLILKINFIVQEGSRGNPDD